MDNIYYYFSSLVISSVLQMNRSHDSPPSTVGKKDKKCPGDS